MMTELQWTARRIWWRRWTGVAVLFSLTCGTTGASAAPIYFLVAERPGTVTHGDSYVLPLSDPADIAHARGLLAADPVDLAPIVVAYIAAGADGINRDHLAAGQPEWSWHVSEFIGFADFTVEILDGWPTFVEQDVPGWIANTNSTIGFWSYTVVAELGVVPEPTSAGLACGGLAGLAFAPRRRKRCRSFRRARR